MTSVLTGDAPRSVDCELCPGGAARSARRLGCRRWMRLDAADTAAERGDETLVTDRLSPPAGHAGTLRAAPPESARALGAHTAVFAVSRHLITGHCDRRTEYYVWPVKTGRGGRRRDEFARR